MINVNGSSVDGNVTISGFSTFSLKNTLIDANLNIQGLTGTSSNSLCGVTLKTNLFVDGNASTIVIGSSSSCAGNTVQGKVDITNNTGAISVFGNAITNKLSCTGNNASLLTGGGNTASQKMGQCSAYSTPKCD